MQECFPGHGTAAAILKEKDPRPISVRDLHDWIQNEIHLSLAKAPFDANDAGLVPTAGPFPLHRRRRQSSPDAWPQRLTLKEPSARTSPLIFQRLLEVNANFFAVTEWNRESPDKSRNLIQSRRRHFHTTKRSFINYMNTSDAPASAQDVLVNDSKEAQIQELGDALKELEVKGNYFGKFSLTVVIYDLDRAKAEAACADFYKVFSIHDAQLHEERYNLLNAYLAAVPGNYPFNVRYMHITNANYADYSFLFTSLRRLREPAPQEGGQAGLCGGRQKCPLDVLPCLEACPVAASGNGNLVASAPFCKPDVREADLGRELLHRR